MATKSAAAAAPSPKSSGSSEDLGAALQRVLNDAQSALGQLFEQSQRQVYDEQVKLTQAVQQVEFDQRRADGEAHWDLMASSREAAEAQDASKAFADRQAYDQGVMTRQQESMQRIADAEQEFRQFSEGAEADYVASLGEIQRAQVEGLKAIWADIDVQAVEPDLLMALGQATISAAHGLASIPVPAAVGH